jgi:hypothetical protein
MPLKEQGPHSFKVPACKAQKSTATMESSIQCSKTGMSGCSRLRATMSRPSPVSTREAAHADRAPQAVRRGLVLAPSPPEGAAARSVLFPAL